MPLGELVDVEKEIARLAKDLKNAEGEVARSERQALQRRASLAKAPANLVRSRARKASRRAQDKVAKLKARMEEMEALR